MRPVTREHTSRGASTPQGRAAAWLTHRGLVPTRQPRPEDDLNQIKDAQGDLSEARKQEVESANQAFTSEVEAVAGDGGVPGAV
jgi:hypothetical protein